MKNLEQISTQGARCVVTGAKPLVQTRRVELLLAGLAAQFWKRIVTAVNHRETDHTVIHTLETLVHIALPQN